MIDTAFVSSTRIPTVGVMGSGKLKHERWATTLGEWLAANNVNLLTGGGSGVMHSVSCAFAKFPNRQGRVIGILPGRFDDASNHYNVPDGYPNLCVEIPIFTHLPKSGEQGQCPESRNHINVLSSDVVVVLPGSSGTASEASLAVRYSKPVVAWLDDRMQVAGLPDEVPVYSEFDLVTGFINSALERFRG